MFFSLWSFVLLTALVSDPAGRWGKARITVSLWLVLGMGLHVALFLIANNFVSTSFGAWKATQIAYFFSEYTMLTLIVVYPVTWFDDVQRWQNQQYGPLI